MPSLRSGFLEFHGSILSCIRCCPFFSSVPFTFPLSRCLLPCSFPGKLQLQDAAQTRTKRDHGPTEDQGRGKCCMQASWRYLTLPFLSFPFSNNWLQSFGWPSILDVVFSLFALVRLLSIPFPHLSIDTYLARIPPFCVFPLSSSFPPLCVTRIPHLE